MSDCDYDDGCHGDNDDHDYGTEVGDNDGDCDDLNNQS